MITSRRVLNVAMLILITAFVADASVVPSGSIARFSIQTDESVDSLREAVKRDRKDLRAWHALGVALEKQGEVKEARKAHETAAKLGDRLVNAQLDQLDSLDDFESLLESIRPQLLLAAESARDYVRLADQLSPTKREEWTLRVESLDIFANTTEPDGATLYTSKEVDERARILSKPEPH